MKRFYRAFSVFFSLTLTCALTACGNPEPAQPSASEISVNAPSNRPSVEVADPQKALDEIYAEVNIKGLSDATEKDMEDLFSFDMDTVSEFYVRYSSGRYGVADVYIVKPAEEDEQAMQQMMERLRQIQLSRMAEFENYNIYNAYQIAQNAQVFSRGGYAVLLMLDDMSRAREIIYHYIPQ